MRLGYIRVSGVDKSIARQLDGIVLDRTFEDTCSGNSMKRPALDRLKDCTQVGDTVVVHDISRLARNVGDLIAQLRFFNTEGVAVEFRREALTFTSDETKPTNKLMLEVLESVCQFERELVLERRREGIAKAQRAGKYRGRQNSIDRKTVWACLDQRMSIRRTADYLGISAASVQKIKKER